jgi:hypothetical protein
MSSNHGLPSMGSATGSRIDSAAKHIMACKVHTNVLGQWRSEQEQTLDIHSCFHNSKMKWCMHKDEVVLNTGKLMDRESDSTVNAYPMVVTTVGDMDENLKRYLRELYNQQTATNFLRFHEPANCNLFAETTFTNVADAEEKLKKTNALKSRIELLPEFRCQGIALGQAWASYLSGDTVASVLVGGMFTVQNGAFTMNTGDQVQWYFDFEESCFLSANKDNGMRSPPGTVNDSLHNKRKRFNDERLFGLGVSLGQTSGQKNAKSMVRIKSYRMRKQVLDAVNTLLFDHFGDKTRIFAKCISGGRPWDAVDIMLMTQSS